MHMNISNIIHAKYLQSAWSDGEDRISDGQKSQISEVHPVFLTFYTFRFIQYIVSPGNTYSNFPLLAWAYINIIFVNPFGNNKLSIHYMFHTSFFLPQNLLGLHNTACIHQVSSLTSHNKHVEYLWKKRQYRKENQKTQIFLTLSCRNIKLYMQIKYKYYEPACITRYVNGWDNQQSRRE